jgi:hypothetical protein
VFVISSEIALILSFAAFSGGGFQVLPPLAKLYVLQNFNPPIAWGFA